MKKRITQPLQPPQHPVKVGDIYEWYDAEEDEWLYYMIIRRYGEHGERVDHLLLNDGTTNIGDYTETFADIMCVNLVG